MELLKFIPIYATTRDYLRLPMTTHHYLRQVATSCNYPRLPATTRYNARHFATTYDYLRLSVTASGYPQAGACSVLYTLSARGRNQQPERSREKLNVFRPLARERRGNHYSRDVTYLSSCSRRQETNCKVEFAVRSAGFRCAAITRNCRGHNLRGVCVQRALLGSSFRVLDGKQGNDKGVILHPNRLNLRKFTSRRPARSYGTWNDGTVVLLGRKTFKEMRLSSCCRSEVSSSWLTDTGMNAAECPRYVLKPVVARAKRRERRVAPAGRAWQRASPLSPLDCVRHDRCSVAQPQSRLAGCCTFRRHLAYRVSRFQHAAYRQLPAIHAVSLLASHQGDPGSIPGRVTPDFRMWESCRTIPLICGLSRESPVSPVPSFRCRCILTSITLIDSQDLHFTHSYLEGAKGVAKQ
ncbi:hypothetical protein PR048_018524 [Dryococelus australis]|uniref:Uncharacterized protein n=1 Tax=Dryococelus australis TaxID=614101 RepID=A0ABQ9HCX1_9NEOP|nr:hypothetical protein PR048_018524 [Dryococelus australis]